MKAFAEQMPDGRFRAAKKMRIAGGAILGAPPKSEESHENHDSDHPRRPTGIPVQDVDRHVLGRLPR